MRKPQPATGIPWSPGEAASVNEFLSTPTGHQMAKQVLCQAKKPKN